MKIQSTLSFMANNSVLVKGQTFTCDKDGIVEVPSEIGVALLKNKEGWRLLPNVVRKPIAKPDFEAMTKNQLLEYASSNKVEVDPKLKKQELINLLER